MRRIYAFGLAALTILGTGGCATGRVAMVETDYPRGSLGVAAIDRGDLASAERALTQGPMADSQDPARLINLGYVYLQTGRTAQAVTVLRQALAHPHSHELVTMNGREVNSHALIRELLSRAETRMASAPR